MDLGESLPAPAKWMQMVAAIRSETLDAVKAATHVDGTNRAQVCSHEDNPRFHQLLSAYGQASGLAALLNTSFNDSGYPIVATPAEALLMFARTDLDAVVINDALVRKVTA
jgi:predicted NodU family carbamoyl transferase